MNKIICAFSIVAIFMWTLPLGAFINPADQKIVCGGNRALHMCLTGFTGNENKTNGQKIFFTNGWSGQQTAKAPGSSSGSSFLMPAKMISGHGPAFRLLSSGFVKPQMPYHSVPAPIPKF
ncbi:MAG: hypothetical protein KC649_02570 [Candidatus Omnitrophica bacterium]|nr:hypothetical protein [Candidatus Omnitrophota bacterium]